MSLSAGAAGLKPDGRFMQNPRDIYELIQDKVAEGPCVDELLIGLTWTLCRSGEACGLAMSPGIATRTLPWAGTLRGRQLKELSAWLTRWSAYEAVVGMAASNACINAQNALMQEGVLLRNPGAANLSVFEHLLPQLRGQKVAVIGRYPGLERFEQDFELQVLERQPSDKDLPDPAAEFVLPEMDWVFLTSTSIPNKTFPRLLELSRDANLVLMGPTTPWLEELAEFGVDYLAGVVVDDAQQLRQTVAEGGGTRIFEGGVSYACVDLRARKMRDVKANIADLYARREQLKQQLEACQNQAAWRQVMQDLEALDVQLSSQDSQYKQLWDSQQAMQLRLKDSPS